MQVANVEIPSYLTHYHTEADLITCASSQGLTVPVVCCQKDGQHSIRSLYMAHTSRSGRVQVVEYGRGKVRHCIKWARCIDAAADIVISMQMPECNDPAARLCDQTMQSHRCVRWSAS